MTPHDDAVTVGIDGLQAIIDVLVDRGMAVHGPEVRDGAIVIRPLTSVEQLPVGWSAVQGPGRYELVRREDRARFGWAVGPQSWKPLLHPPRVRTLTMSQPNPEAPVAVTVTPRRPPQPIALFGVRPCEFAAITRLDRVLLERPASPEPVYAGRRSEAFIVVVNCGAPAATCFCTSMGTGPHLSSNDAGFDLEITELSSADPGRDPSYVVRAATGPARGVMADVAERAITRGTTRIEGQGVEQSRLLAVAEIERELDATRIPGLLGSVHDDPRWDDIASRCLACGNCTAACPTCFCTSLDDVGDLDGTITDRWRSWDSCFSLEFSRLGSGTTRTSVASRYRQWFTHKLSTWYDQFDESGCVGCGRCITWCPVGIDLTREARGFVDAGTVTVP